MNFQTKFDLNQKVYVFGRKRRVGSEPCPHCGGRGRVSYRLADDSGDGETYCPNRECRNGRVEWYELWQFAGTARVGMVEIEAYAPKYGRTPYTEKYMLDSTGVGSGTVYSYANGAWTHTHLFATRAEGEAWAAEQNAPILAEVEETRARMAAKGRTA